jgi:ubiquinol-cytochrome c reductase iron-sulfur subunit
MSNQGKMDCGRRRLIVATAAVGGVGAVAALVPFVSSLLPSERAKAAGAPVEVDISKLEPGQMMTVEWRGKPVWIINRTKEMLETLPKLAMLSLTRSRKRISNQPMPRTIPVRLSLS